MASFYDLDHQWRDYAKQADLVREILPESGEVLDLCCGSGSHAVQLALRGFNVFAVDRSADLVLQAQKKLADFSAQVTVQEEDIFNLHEWIHLHSRFDAALLLGWTLSVDPMFERLEKLLDVLSSLLKPEGVFIFDAPIGTNFNRVSQEPLEYETPQGSRGVLNIEMKKDAKKKKVDFSYRWNIFQEGGKL
ncbi:MAG: class I SAM-dependent methyltransferase [Elusimicrobia bacterium]|nr:class I SAM-dependent methyltransferase [Elusimicrobiota bacterium]